MIRRLLALPTVLVVLGLLVATGAGSAQGASGDLRVSLDGVRWSTSLPIGLFAGSSTVVPGNRRSLVGSSAVVPGDSMSRTLWVKNVTSSAGMFQLSRVETAATNSLLSRAISITATVSGATGANPHVSGACALLLPEIRIGAGQSVPIIVTLTVADLHGIDAQNDAASISLLASLSDPDGTTAASPCAEPGTTIPVAGGAQPAAESNGSLAFTGTQLAYPAIMIASLLTGLGLFFFVAARRRRRSA